MGRLTMTKGLLRNLVFVAPMALFLAACAPAPQAAPASQPSRASAPTQAPAAPTATPTPSGPRYGGTLRYLVAEEPACLDIYRCNAAHAYQSPMQNLLVQYDPREGKILAPDLAESWQASADGRTYTFKVRQGVKFHDGTPWTADDMQFNLQRIVFPLKGDVGQMAWALAPVTESIEKVDNATVRVNLKAPFAPFLSVLAIDYYPMYSKAYILDKKGDPGRSPMGTGPFRLESFTPGVGAKLTKNTDYWEKGLPYVDGVQLVLVKDQATRKAAIRTHSVDITAKIFSVFSAGEVKEIQKDATQVAFKPLSSATAPWFFLNSTAPPFNDRRVQQAIHLAIDREAAVNILADGQGRLGGYFSNIPGWGLTDQELRRLPGFGNKDAERERAKKLLADAGYPNGFSFSILCQMLTNKPACEFVAGQLQTIGIQGQVQVEELATFWPRVRRGDFQAFVIPPANIAGDPVTQGRFFVPGGSLNYTGHKDPKIVEMWTKQTQEMDSAKRRDLIKQLDTYLFEQTIPSIPLVSPRLFMAYWPNVQGVVLPVTDFAGGRLDRVWLNP